MIYLDNAATSFPKAPGVPETVADFLTNRAGSPGRSGHRTAVAAQRCVEDCRRNVARLFGIGDPSRMVFTLNATDAINIALKGTLRPGDHVISTEMEHNSVARPLTDLQSRGVGITRVPASSEGLVDVDAARDAFRASTRVVALSHVSNVTGTIQPIEALTELAHEHGALIVIDAAQSAGCLPIDLSALPVDLLACSGHKGLLGPTGTGVLYVREGVEVSPLREGGTGSLSESDEHPLHLPDRLEAGTPNTTGLAGLDVGVRFLLDRTVTEVRTHEMALCEQLWEGLASIEGVTLHGPPDASRRGSALSLTIDGFSPGDVAAILDSSFGIAARAGLHCAPRAHRSIGTFPAGTVRLSPGCFNTSAEIETTVEAVHSIAGSV